jgi:hypothetical protein
LTEAAARVRELARDYDPPTFAHVPDPDSAIFLCAIDHGTGYRSRHRVGGRGPFAGSALLWELGLLAARREQGLLTAPALTAIDASRVAEIFRIGGETASDPEARARLWRDLAAGLERDYSSSAAELIAASEGRLAGGGGLVDRLAEFDAYADPLAKKALLFAKIAERRGWMEVADPESWEVCADSVLMRLALRAGLVEPGDDVDDVRAATRAAFRSLAEEAEVSTPVLDDLLWELGRDDPDLLGSPAGDLREPARSPGSHWY